MEANSISLRDTLGPVSFVSAGDVVASEFCCDSRLLQPGDVFVAISGPGTDGHQFVEAAVRAGASAVVLERPNPRIAVPQCIVTDTRAAFAAICLAQHGNPEKNLIFAGVTGTNGKTTSTWLLRGILEAAGKTAGLLGTIQYDDGLNRYESKLTTPAPPQLAALLAQMSRQNASHCVMELSSHALDQRRCAGIRLSTAAITNITRDHFDYHGNLQNYMASKARIADLLKPGCSLLIGTDDAGCREVQPMLSNAVEVRTFGFSENADLRVEVLSASPRGQQLRLWLAAGKLTVRTPLAGRHNALNVLTAASMAEQLGVEPQMIADAIEQLTCVPGRMERIDAGQPFTVLVDYAHTPDGLVHCIATARTLTRGKVTLVFGAGGDRDREKRPLMAKAAMAADSVIVTSDNPRSESPQQIIDEICAGFSSMDSVQVCVDRSKAIRLAIHSAGTDDVVIVAGRGHETVQWIGDRSISFDDRRVAMRHLKELMLQHHHSDSRRPDAVPA